MNTSTVANLFKSIANLYIKLIVIYSKNAYQSGFFYQSALILKKITIGAYETIKIQIILTAFNNLGTKLIVTFSF